MQDITAAGSPRSGSASPNDTAVHDDSQQQQQQPAVLYIKGPTDSEDKPVSVVFRQAAYVQRPEKPGRLLRPQHAVLQDSTANLTLSTFERIIQQLSSSELGKAVYCVVVSEKG